MLSYVTYATLPGYALNEELEQDGAGPCDGCVRVAVPALSVFLKGSIVHRVKLAVKSHATRAMLV